jgi:hypothetical protein
MAATVASGAASLANPYGIQGVLFPLILLRRVQGPDREFYHRFSDELKGVDDLLAERGLPGLVEDATSILLLVVAMLVAATFALLLTQRRFNLYRAMLFAAFAYLAWQMTRNCVLFAVGAGVVLRLNVGELVEASRGMARRSAGDHGAPRGVVPPARRWPEAATAVALGLLVVSIPSGAYHRVRSAWPTRKLHLGEAAWHAHSAAEFLNRPGFPRCIYAAHEGVAAVCIYHLAPQRRVFADPRLEVNTRQTLQRYLDVRRQLAQGDPAAEANLLRNIAPGPDGRRQMPALVFDNRTLFYESLKDPPLLQGILQTGRWRCVLCDTKVDSGRSDATPILDGAAVFLASDQAEKLGLPAANTGWLELAIACRRRAGG